MNREIYAAKISDNGTAMNRERRKEYMKIYQLTSRDKE